MKRVTIIVEIDLGLVLDDHEVTQKKCEECIEVGDLVSTSYDTLEITARDIDTNRVVDYIVPKGDDE